jgi:hypothetical protein
LHDRYLTDIDMPQVHLSANENFVFLNYLGVDYIRDGNPSPIPPYTLYQGQNGSPCNPTVEYWTSEVAQSVSVDTGQYINDGNGGSYLKLNGNRPSNIKKR